MTRDIHFPSPASNPDAIIVDGLQSGGPRRFARVLKTMAATFTLGAASCACHALELVDVKSLAPAIKVEMRYNTDDNFMARKIAGYKDNVCLLTPEAARGIARVQEALRKQGLTLKMFDCYRPQIAVDDMHSEILRHSGTRLDGTYIPNIDKTTLIKQGLVAQVSGHTYGYAVDLTIARAAQAQSPRIHKVCTDSSSIGRDELDMGTSYDCFDPKSETLNPGISAEAKKNRKFFVDLMAREGFGNFAKEWWHFNFKRQF